jgi:hypothetical protein
MEWNSIFQNFSIPQHALAWFWPNFSELWKMRRITRVRFFSIPPNFVTLRTRRMGQTHNSTQSVNQTRKLQPSIGVTSTGHHMDVDWTRRLSSGYRLRYLRLAKMTTGNPNKSDPFASMDWFYDRSWTDKTALWAQVPLDLLRAMGRCGNAQIAHTVEQRYDHGPDNTLWFWIGSITSTKMHYCNQMLWTCRLIQCPCDVM